MEDRVKNGVMVFRRTNGDRWPVGLRTTERKLLVRRIWSPNPKSQSHQSPIVCDRCGLWVHNTILPAHRSQIEQVRVRPDIILDNQRSTVNLSHHFQPPANGSE